MATAVAPADRAGTGGDGALPNPPITNFVANALCRDGIRRETPDVMWITFLTNM
jgi:hypothetical protein